jgi:hypothetical protein
MTSTRNDRRATKGGGLARASAIDQEELFGSKPGAGDVGPATRASHPITSHRAAGKAADKLTLKQLAVADVLQRIKGTPTHEEIVREYGERRADTRAADWYPWLTDSSVRTRVKELVALGYVEKHDEAGRSARGNAATRWKLTAAGVLLDVRRLTDAATMKLAQRVDRALRRGRYEGPES